MLLEQRLLAVAFPYNCISIYKDVTVVYLIYSLILKLPSTAFAIQRWRSVQAQQVVNDSRSEHLLSQSAADNGTGNALAHVPGLSGVRDQLDDKIRNISTLLFASLVLLALGLSSCGFFLRSQTPHTAGHCPDDVYNNSYQADIFRSHPVKGGEISHCKWRTWNEGSCIRYPYDYELLGHTEMDDPALGRWTGTNMLNTTCGDIKGLLSCATYSPHVGDFLEAFVT